MIKNSIGVLFIALCMYSCSPEDFTHNQTKEAQGAIVKNQKQALTADNPANPYDQAGKIHNRLLSALENEQVTASLQSIVTAAESHALNDNDFIALTGTAYHPISQIQKDIIANNTIENELSSSPISDAAQQHLSWIFAKVAAPGYKTETFDVFYRSLVSYEDNIIRNPSLPGLEKKVILVTSSIARHAAAYDKGKGKDKDWRLTINNIVAAAYGATESEAKAITISLTTGLYVAPN